MAGQTGHQEFKIAGHTVLFPCKPYPSQFSMMDKIIRGIERHQNCLLESPTGSGKSLALLCSALAWQTNEKKKQNEEKQELIDSKAETCMCPCHASKPDETPTSKEPTHSAENAAPASSVIPRTPELLPKQAGVAASSTPQGKSCGSVIIDDELDEDFKPAKQFKNLGKSKMKTRKKRSRVSIEYEDSPSSSPVPGPSAASPQVASRVDNDATPAGSLSGSGSRGGVDADTACSQCSCVKGAAQKGAPRKVPKIYFGTRTHKQVAQIVRELRKTAYHDVQMTILASREHTCIHPMVANSPNKNEGCENLLKDAGCRFKDQVMKYQSHSAIRGIGLDSAWDLEDLVELMKKKKCCPYFLSRGLKDQSDLIICPYNYLVDPIIRESMEINLKGQIVLLDEAHNIEDAVREAASQSITQEQIQRAVRDMDSLIERGEKVADVSKLREMCYRLDNFIEHQSSSLTQRDFEQSYRMWSGFEIIAQLQLLHLCLEKYKELVATLNSIKAAELEERMHTPGGEQHVLSSATCGLLEQVFLVLRYLYKDDMKFAEDYRASVVKSIQYVSPNLNGSWLSSRRNGGRKVPVEMFTLNFWCMNPAVGFADFGDCRSVILTSGTLSPMDTFQSELGLPFPIVLEANHIISNSQVWVGAVGQGSDGTSLQAVYRNMERFDFQDSLGQLVLDVCSKVPKGVLCFLPSYKTLEKLTSRWKVTGLWQRLQRHKWVLSEPRGYDKQDFEQVLKTYYSIINHGAPVDDEDEDDGAASRGGIDGALLFAVCRGKVSEGMDFADNFARAVITVGIPYPNFKDIQVELKRSYNDKYQASRGLLSGHLWYEIQAFRALNQALGRCIRHRNDWGALIIVDDRFVKNTNKYANGLSKWVRQKLQVHRDCSSMLDSLSSFTDTRLEADQLDQSMSTSQMASSQPLTSSSLTEPIPVVHASPTPSVAETLPDLQSPSGVDHTPAQRAFSAAAATAHTPDGRVPLHDVSNVTRSSRVIPAAVTSETALRSKAEGSAGSAELRSTLDRKAMSPVAAIVPSRAVAQKDTAGLKTNTRAVTKDIAAKPAAAVNGQQPDVIAGPNLTITLSKDGIVQKPVDGSKTASLAKGSLSATLLVPTAASRQPAVLQAGILTAQKSVRASSTSQVGKGAAATSQRTVGGSGAGVKPAESTVSQTPAAGSGVAGQTSKAADGGAAAQMIYVPLMVPVMKTTMLILPDKKSGQTVLHLPPNIQQAAGISVISVPPGIQHVVFAKTLDEAVNLYNINIAAAPPPTPPVNPSCNSQPALRSLLHNKAVSPALQPVPASAGTVPGGTSSLLQASVSSGLVLKDNSPRSCSTVAGAQLPTFGAAKNTVKTTSPVTPSPQSKAKGDNLSKSTLAPPAQKSQLTVCPSAASTPATRLTPAADSLGCKRRQEKVGNRKRLFRVTPRKGTDDNKSLASVRVEAGSDTEESSETESCIAATRPDDKARPSSEAGSGEAVETPAAETMVTVVPRCGTGTVEETMEERNKDKNVRRRSRGSKRRSLSLNESCENKKSRASSEQAGASSMKCKVCGYLLLDNVVDTEFEHRATVPTCLKGLVDQSKPDVLYFRGATVTERLNLPPSAFASTRSQSCAGGMEASVQLFSCPGCLSAAQPSSVPSLIGAKVTLSDTASAVSTGQMWIFAHMVTLENS